MTAAPPKRIGVLATTVLAALAVAAIPAAAQQIDDKKAEAAALAAKLEGQAAEIVALDKQHRAAREQLAQAQVAVTRAELELAAIGRRHDDARNLLVAHAQHSYMGGGSVSFLGNMVGSDGDDVTVRRTYLQVVTGEDTQAIGRLRAAGEDLRLQRSRLEDARRKAGATAEAIADDREALAAAIASQRALLTRLNGEVATLVAAEQARRDAEASRLAAARRAAGDRAPVAAATAGRAAATPKQAAAPAPGPTGDSVDETFACIRQLESGNNYSTPGGGAYQFLDSTWQSLGYSGTASDHPPHVQDEAARKLLARSGWSQWTTAPLCGRV